jgi:hypothetical protein
MGDGKTTELRAAIVSLTRPVLLDPLTLPPLVAVAVEYGTLVGLYASCMQITHTLQAPGCNP